LSFTIYDASVPVFVNSLNDMHGWFDKALAEHDETKLMQARLAPDMRPFASQIQIASDTAKGAVARLGGVEPPSMADTEASFAELKERCARTVAFIESVDPTALADAGEREVVLKLGRNGSYRFTGRDYLARFALPNFFFHVTTAYAILRNQGVPLGKADFLRHIGPPNLTA
jgi:hypothetical protein